jgi:flavorubredoxin
MESKGQIDEIDTQHALEIADRVWWVGHYMHGDDFQSHTYLIENGSQSVLIDPGSQLTFSNTLSKIEEVIPFSQIRYFICHHQRRIKLSNLHAY